MFFQYDETATDYLKRKDKRLGAVIDALGHIDRTVDTDLFAAVVHHIIGQQISTKAQETLWRRMQDGLGEVTAEMLLLFCLQRPDILSYGDLAILRGMRMVYHHRKIDKKKFEMYRRRLSPYGSVASLYFWAVAGGAIPGMKDYVPKKKGK